MGSAASVGCGCVRRRSKTAPVPWTAAFWDGSWVHFPLWNAWPRSRLRMPSRSFQMRGLMPAGIMIVNSVCSKAAPAAAKDALGTSQQGSEARSKTSNRRADARSALLMLGSRSMRRGLRQMSQPQAQSENAPPTSGELHGELLVDPSGVFLSKRMT